MEVSGRDRLTLLAVVMLPMLVWWAAFYPGTFTNDSLTVIDQIRNGTWSNANTNAYMTFVWFTSIGGSQWGLVALAQIILLALGLASLGEVIIRAGIPRLLVMVAISVFALLPQVGAFAVTMWKDVPSTAGVVMLASALLSQRVSRSSRRSTLWLAAAGALLLGAFRWNGPIALVLLSVFVLFLERRSSLKFVAVLLGVAAMSVGTLLLPQRMNLASSIPWQAVDNRNMHDIAYVYHERPRSFNDDHTELMAKVMPLERWSEGGSTCETTDVLYFQNILQLVPDSLQKVDEYQNEFRTLWRHTLREEPLLVAWSRLCRAGGVWSPVFFGKQPTLGLVYLHSNDPELGRPGHLAGLERSLIRAVMVTSSSETSKTLTLNAMLWTLVALLLALVLRTTTFPRLFLQCLPVSVAVMFSIMLVTVAHDVRYVAGALLLAQFFVGVSVLDWIWTRFCSNVRRPGTTEEKVATRT